MGCDARPKLEVETTHEPELGAPASLPACRGVGPETRRQGCRRSQSCDRCPNACAKAKGADEPACSFAATKPLRRRRREDAPTRKEN